MIIKIQIFTQKMNQIKLLTKNKESWVKSIPFTPCKKQITNSKQKA